MSQAVRQVYNINSLLAQFVQEVKGAGAINDTAINRLAEHIVLPLFKYTYGYTQLKNLNTAKHSNYPAIDLGDEKKRVAIQVTSSATLAKIKDTLQKFVDHKLYNDYDRLIIYFLTEKPSLSRKTNFDDIVQGKFRFDKDKDLQDYRDIMAVVGSLPPTQTDMIEYVLEGFLTKDVNRIEFGWNWRGIIPVITFFFLILLLLLLVSIVLQISFLIVSVVIIVTISLVILLLYRTGRQRLKRFSNQVVQPFVQIALWFGCLFIFGTNGWLGGQQILIERQCNELGYLRYGDKLTLAAINDNVDNLYMHYFVQTLNTAGGEGVIAAQTSLADLSKCSGRFQYQLRINRVASSASEEVTYIAAITNSISQESKSTETQPGPDGCSHLGLLSYKVIDTLNLQAVQVNDIMLPGPKHCDAWVENEQGYDILAKKQQQDYEKAKNHFTTALEKFQNYANAHANLGELYIRQGNIDEAIDELEKADKLANYKFPPYRIDLARAYYRNGDNDKAERVNLEIIELSTASLLEKAKAANNLSVVYRQMQDYNHAMNILNDAEGYLSQIPDNQAKNERQAVAKNRGIIEFQQDHLDKAREILVSANKPDSQYEEEIVFYLALIDEKIRPKQACSTWQRYLHITRNGLFEEEARLELAKQRVQVLNCP